jgi:hypothetical protein
MHRKQRSASFICFTSGTFKTLLMHSRCQIIVLQGESASGGNNVPNMLSGQPLCGSAERQASRGASHLHLQQADGCVVLGTAE